MTEAAQGLHLGKAAEARGGDRAEPRHYCRTLESAVLPVPTGKLEGSSFFNHGCLFFFCQLGWAPVPSYSNTNLAVTVMVFHRCY